MRVFNTLGNSLQEFVPVNPPKVGMYVCGVTVYDTVHVGHARCYVSFDLIRRYLEYRGYEVIHTQNFTDIDDKIINRSRTEQRDWRELTATYIREYFRYMDQLGVKRAHNYPKASETVDQMITIIQGLLDKGHAYIATNGDVYFSVQTFPGYGALVSSARLEQETVSRVAESDVKRSPNDFALWKAAKPGEPFWPSPWGNGRPGWHIECSAMTLQQYKGTFDIHGGGLDLIFPHHTNEIAQTECYTGHKTANYWLHNGFIKVDNDKMSKSLGNFITLQDAIDRHGAAALRMFFVKTHYRSPLNFDLELIDDSKGSIDRLVDAIGDAEAVMAYLGERNEELNKSGRKLSNALAELEQKFVAAMDDDFNSPAGLAVIFEFAQALFAYVRSVAAPNAAGANTSLLAQSVSLLRKLLLVLGFKTEERTYDADRLANALIQAGFAVSPGVDPLEQAVELRNLLRREKNYTSADRVRDIVSETTGLTVKDWPFGSVCSRLSLIVDTDPRAFTEAAG
ncbi:MAG: cysteine--tRNA ligase [Planctomycetota bacterium]